MTIRLFNLQILRYKRKNYSEIWFDKNDVDDAKILPVEGIHSYRTIF